MSEATPLDSMYKDLLPCAHCGSENIKIVSQPYFVHELNQVKCFGCGMQTHYNFREKAIESWNKRYAKEKVNDNK